MEMLASFSIESNCRLTLVGDANPFHDFCCKLVPLANFNQALQHVLVNLLGIVFNPAWLN